MANANLSVVRAEVDEQDRMTFESALSRRVGEVPTATVSPVVANAVFAATGKRIRRLPIKAPDVSPER